ncbi:hypothetical protein AMAG_10914 [Allomyces macrogynus ATCC 38327]|uniref:Nitrogen permease regulator 2 n=1 Tax=Allomyces macrogynus (strain ATCC 38327) TaxID=578462 RepID=A0A0L0SSD0_ALLM3|nr:hypothetical protein AMAG_10914 [Allomyces macrogynus ATCC 38327]|eukprot:KNE65270.1 hypothetical protein AMAG_10914 [Allomyces macrogynus ATCC 38327]
MGRRAFHPPLLAIFLCEFDAKNGNQIVLALSSASPRAPSLDDLPLHVVAPHQVPALAPVSTSLASPSAATPVPAQTPTAPSHPTLYSASAPCSPAPHAALPNDSLADALRRRSDSHGPATLGRRTLSPRAASLAGRSRNATAPGQLSVSRQASVSSLGPKDDFGSTATATADDEFPVESLPPLPPSPIDAERRDIPAPDRNNRSASDPSPSDSPPNSTHPPPAKTASPRLGKMPSLAALSASTLPLSSTDLAGGTTAAALSSPSPRSQRPTLRSLFDTIPEYLIPKPELCGQVVSIAVDRYRLVGHPIYLKDESYERNMAIWNAVFVVPREADARGWHRVVTKLARTLKQLEVESRYMTTVANRAALYALLHQVLYDLNTLRETRVVVNPGTVLELYALPEPAARPPPIRFWDVPVARIDFATVAMDDWDVTVRRIVPHIDGVRTVAAVADRADADLDLARLAIEHLVHLGAVHVVDLFQGSNTYVVTPRLRRLAHDAHVQAECVRAVTRADAAVAPTPTRVLTVYAMFKHGATVQQVASDRAFPSHLVDIRRLVVVGVLRGWLRRVHRFPVWHGRAPPVHLAVPLDPNDKRRMAEAAAAVAAATAAAAAAGPTFPPPHQQQPGSVHGRSAPTATHVGALASPASPTSPGAIGGAPSVRAVSLAAAAPRGPSPPLVLTTTNAQLPSLYLPVAAAATAGHHAVGSASDVPAAMVTAASPPPGAAGAGMVTRAPSDAASAATGAAMTVGRRGAPATPASIVASKVEAGELVPLDAYCVVVRRPAHIVAAALSVMPGMQWIEQ